MDSKNNSRFVSRLTRHTLALVLAGGRGSRHYELTDWGCKSEVPFGGNFHIIDFALSNCVNSGIRRIGVLTQYKAHSLIRHLMNGWSFLPGELGEFVEILPASQRVGGEWYMGTADSLYQNLDIIRNHKPEFVLVLSGDQIYKMDYGDMLVTHVDNEADMTVSCLELPIEEAAGTYGVLSVDDTGLIIGFTEKPEEPVPIPGSPGLCLASMGNYVFNSEFLYEQLIKDADDPTSDHDFGRDIIPSIIEKYQIYAHSFRDAKSHELAYWRDVGTLDAYWLANMELLNLGPEIELYDRDWPIYTDQTQLPPASFQFDAEDRRGTAVNSVISSGCVISGALVRQSLLFTNVKVHSYSDILESVILPDVTIGRNARIRKAIIDRSCNIEDGMLIGEDHDEDRARGFRVTDKGIVLVTPDMLRQLTHQTR